MLWLKWFTDLQINNPCTVPNALVVWKSGIWYFETASVNENFTTKFFFTWVHLQMACRSCPQSCPCRNIISSFPQRCIVTKKRSFVIKKRRLSLSWLFGFLAVYVTDAEVFRYKLNRQKADCRAGHSRQLLRKSDTVYGRTIVDRTELKMTEGKTVYREYEYGTARLLQV